MFRLIKKGASYVLEVPKNLTIKEIKELQLSLSKGIEIERVETISLEQLKLLWCLFRELGDLIGYTKEEMREVLQAEFCYYKKIPIFSLSNSKENCISQDLATEFIQWIIEWSIEQGYNIILHEGYGEKRTLKQARDIVPDIKRYVLACLRNKTCCKCGATNGVDLHHTPALGVPYEQDDGLKTGFMSLCRKCHSEAHTRGLKEFEEYYHLQGVWLNPNLVNELKKIYKNHFRGAI